jgi:hypothetical protein
MIFNYRTKDPRLYQIGMLGALLIYGLWVLDLEVEIAFAATIIATALATQYAFHSGGKTARLRPQKRLDLGLIAVPVVTHGFDAYCRLGRGACNCE